MPWRDPDGFEAEQSGWLRDDVNTETGTVRVTGRYLTPRLEKFGTFLVFPVFAVLLSLIIWISSGPRPFVRLRTDSIAVAITAYVVLCVLAAVITFFLVRALRRKVDVMIGFDMIDIGGQRFARNVPIEFSVQTHRRAQDSNPGIYARALEVLMQYGERQIVIAEMRLKDKDKAVALAMRLQGWSVRFDKAMAQAVHQMGGAPQPAGDFGPAPDLR